MRVCLGLLLLVGFSANAQPPDRLEQLRQESLRLVNAARQAKDLRPLSLDEHATEAARSHAQDMLARGYYDHVSPEGETVRDRYVAADGNESHVVRENLAYCAGCPGPADEAALFQMHDGWMSSREHRETILAEGLTHFGFAVAEGGGARYGVQVFAGPGTRRVPDADDEVQTISSEEQLRVAVRLINAIREEAGVQPLRADERLATAAAQLAAEFDAESTDGASPVAEALPAGIFQRIQTLAASCSGCGIRVTASDVRYFIDQWRSDETYVSVFRADGFNALGFAIEADGEGRKTAVALFAR